MGIAKGTVTFYRCHIRSKLGISRIAKVLYLYMQVKQTSRE